MHVYVLPEPRPIERALEKLIAGSRVRRVEWKDFASGEHHCRVLDVSEEVCVIGRIEPPDENLVRTLLLIDTLRRSGAKTINLVLPYFAYARQDRQLNPGDPVSVGCLLRLLAAAGADRIVTTDLHSFRPLEFSPIKIDNVSVLEDMAVVLQPELAGRPYSVVSVDRGGQARAEAFARALGQDEGAVWVEKVRSERGKVAAKGLIGHLNGDTAVIVDDMVDTGGSVIEAVKLLRRRGVRRLYLCFTHPVCSLGSASRVIELGFEKILVSDTLELPPECLKAKNLRVVSAAPKLAAVLR